LGEWELGTGRPGNWKQVSRLNGVTGGRGEKDLQGWGLWVGGGWVWWGGGGGGEGGWGVPPRVPSLRLIGKRLNAIVKEKKKAIKEVGGGKGANKQQFLCVNSAIRRSTRTAQHITLAIVKQLHFSSSHEPEKSKVQGENGDGLKQEIKREFQG